jgi:N-acyl amino acid synthase of PEP-CTERM/exosortase system
MTLPEAQKPSRSIDHAVLKKFLDDYKFTLAKDDQERQKALHLRHEVFLQELNYEMHEDQTKNFETDDYDESSLHCLIEHKRSGILAGCMRLVIPSSEHGSQRNKLPVEIQGRESLNHESIHPSMMPEFELCEVSRLAISKSFRSRQQNKNHTDVVLSGEKFTLEEEKTFPIIAIGLFLCTYSLVGLSNKRHVFAMMEPRLPRLLALSGFHFTQVSDPIEYHGTRYAYYIDHAKAEQEMHKDLMPFYLHIRKLLEPQLKELLSVKSSSSFA